MYYVIQMSDIKRVGIFTTKGGVGKTTIALNLAVLLGEHGKTLLVDMDSNFTVSALLKREITLLENALTEGEKPTKIAGVDMLFGGSMRAITPKIIEKFKEFTGSYDYVVLDFHNSANAIVIPLLRIADKVIIPVVPTYAGMGAFIHTKKVLGEIGADYIGVANMVHRGLFGVKKAEEEVIRKMREKGNFWSGVIPYDSKVAIAELEHAPAVGVAPKFTKSLRELCQEVMGCRQ